MLHRGSTICSLARAVTDGHMMRADTVRPTSALSRHFLDYKALLCLSASVIRLYLFTSAAVAITSCATLVLLEHRCLSVRMSVTLWYCIITNKASVMISLRSESPNILHYVSKNGARILYLITLANVDRF